MNETRNRTLMPVFGLVGALGAGVLAAAGNLALFAGRPPAAPLLIRQGSRAGHTGDVQVQLTWHSGNDLDLYMIDPEGHTIYHGARHVLFGGTLDVDMNRFPPFSSAPVENIYWPHGRAPRGVYRIWVQYYKQHPGGPDPEPFQVRVSVLGAVYTFAGTISQREHFRYVGAFAVGDVPFDPETVDRKGPWVSVPSKPEGRR